MRIAVVSDIHGNLTAFEAVLADLKSTAPDLVIHGGDLADNGSSPVEIVERIRSLGWPGVAGNTDQMLFAPETFSEFALARPHLRELFDVVAEMASWTRDALGAERLAWLRSLPIAQTAGPLAFVHGTPQSPWSAPPPETTGEKLAELFAPLGHPVAAYGHIHRSYIRLLPRLTVANSGSVSLSLDGDPRASYLLLDGEEPTIRRVAYDVEREIQLLRNSGLPHAGWVAAGLRKAGFIMP